MINLKVQDVFAFDYLSILEIKFEKSQTQEAFRAYEMCSIELELEYAKCHDADFYGVILKSEEYKDLKGANLKVFETIDAIHNGLEMTALELDQCNYLRFIAKKKLQEKFFIEPFSEVKIGSKYN